MKTKVAKNFAFTTAYNILNVVIPFLTTPYIARVLGANNTGIYSYSYSVAYYFVIFAMLGLKNYGNRSIASVQHDKNKLTKTFWDIYNLQFILALLTTSFYIIYVVCIAENKKIALILLLYVVSAAFDVTWFLFGIEAFSRTVLKNTLIKVICFVLVFVLVRSQEDLPKYALIMAGGILLSQLFLWTNLYSLVGKRSFCLDDSIAHLKPNLVLFVPVIAISIYNFMDKIMVGQFCTMEQVGYYDYSEKINNIPQEIVAALGTVMLPRITNLLTMGERDKAVKYLQKSIIFVAMVSSACSFGIISVAHEFIMFFLGKGYEPCVDLLYLLSPCLIFKAFANVARTQYIIPRKKDSIYLKSVGLGAVINLALNLILIPRLQAAGACIGTIIAEITVSIYQVSFVLKEERIIVTYAKALAFQVIGLVMFLVLSVIHINSSNTIVLFSKVGIGGIVYIFLSLVYLKFVLHMNMKDILVNEKRG